MKTFGFLLGLCLCGCYHVAAQDTKLIRIKSGEDAGKVVSKDHRYRYDQFRPGTVTFYDGRIVGGSLNYNILLGEMQFIDPKGDTLSLANENTVKVITIGKNRFYYQDKYGYLEELADYSPVKLAINQKLIKVSEEKMGGYGQSSATSAITNYNSYSDNGRVYKLESQGDILLARDTSFFLLDQNNRCHKANRSSIRKLFSDHKKTIDQYLKEESINFSKEEDLKKLLRFCHALSS